MVEQILQRHEALARELADKAREAHDYLRRLAAAPTGPGSKTTARSAEQVVELCRNYPRWRFQSLVLHHLSGAFVGLRGHLSDELREVNFCRVRLTELLRLFEEASSAERRRPLPSSHQGSVGRQLFVGDCKDLSEAVANYLEGITPEHVLALDERMQRMLRLNFTALVHVCLSSHNILRQVEKAMLDTASGYAVEHLPPASVAGLFFEQHPESEAASELADCYHQAGPELTAGRSACGLPLAELNIVAAPADPDSERFLALLHEAVPQAEIQPAQSPDDILFYRERANLPLLALEHMGPLGHDAYTQMSSADHFTPHTRTDVDFRS
jgi:hypothetical protein